MELNAAESSQGYPSSITSPRREQRVVYVLREFKLRENVGTANRSEDLARKDQR